MICDGTIGPYTHCVIIRRDADFSVIGWFTCDADSITTLSVVASLSLTLTPPVWVWMNTCTPFACAAAHTGSRSRDQYGVGGVAGSSTALKPPAATRSISATASPTSVIGTGAVGHSREK